MISKHQKIAENIVRRLQEAGYKALFAGGWVRDFLLGHPSQDIDIATSAHPEEVVKLFKRSITVGAQFGVVRVLQDNHEFEVATFRSDEQYVDGRRPSQVRLLGSPEEDAARRDFTINGMFYDPSSGEIYDYVSGKNDLKRKIIRTIGDPFVRFQEDRLRIIRAIRFKNTFGYDIDSKTWEALCQEAVHVVEAVSPERIWQELRKMLEKKILEPSLRDLHKCGLLARLFPISQSGLEERFQVVARYRGGSLAAAIALLIKQLRNTLVDRYRLSNREAHLFDTFSMFESLPSSDEEYVRLYARADIETALTALACEQANPEVFLAKHTKRQKELAFWTEQVRSRSFLIAGSDLASAGLKPGKQMGERINEIFLFSLHNRIKDKKKLLEECVYGKKD